MKASSNPYVKRIASLIGEQDPSRVVQAFVRKHRTESDSLEDLARKFGVSRIIKQTLPFEGGLFRLRDGELVIKLNSESSFVRRQFTLAHEIAHLLLDTVPAHRSANRTDIHLERLCDSIAAELLMPTEEVTEVVQGLGAPSPENLQAIASRYRVSLQTAAIRLCGGLRLWRCASGMWSLSPKMKTLWFVGPKRWDDVLPAPSLLERAVSSNESFKTTDLWRRRDVSEAVTIDLLGIGSTRAIGLVHFVN